MKDHKVIIDGETTAFTVVEEIRITPDARVFENGWQSFSPSHAYRLDERPYRPSSERNRILNYRQGSAPGDDVFFGEGLLAVENGASQTTIIASAEPFTTAVRVQAQVQENEVVIAADGPVQPTVFDASLEDALRAWARLAATSAGVKPPRSAPTAWCSWYAYYGDVGPEDITANLAQIETLDLPVDVVQLDDGYSAGIGDWLAPSPRFPDVAALITRIKESGHRAGIWIAPFFAAADSPVVAKHPGWLIKRPDGTPRCAGHNWNRDLYSIDLTNPEAADWMRRIIETFVGWGIDYIKTDFLAAGAIPGQRHSGVDPITAYRQGLQLIRDTIGPQAHILGCGAPVLPSVGLVDSLRISADTAWQVEPDDSDYSSPSSAAARFTAAARQFMNGVFFVNDPDCLIVDPKVAKREQWADHVKATRGAVVSSDNLQALDTWGLDTTRRLLMYAADNWPIA